MLRSTLVLIPCFVATALMGCPTRNDADTGSDTGGGGMDTPRADTPGSCTMGMENTAAACSDGCSNDSDMFVDCDDFDCAAFCRDGGPPIDAPPAPACDGGMTMENSVATCSDGCSNDGDRFADCNDFDCCGVVTCGPGTACGTDAGPGGMENTAELCMDGMDNDMDRFIDCDDFDCSDFCGRDAGPPAGSCDGGMMMENTVAACSDGCSNDGDRFADCDDRDCCGVVTCTTGFCARDGGMRSPEDSMAACTDGMDNDGDGFTDCDDFGCCMVVMCTTGACSRDAGMRMMENTLELCSDGISNDGDRFIDCEDRDCCAVRRDCGAMTFCGMRDAGPRP